MVDFGTGKSVSPSFGDVIGQEELKEALLAVATDPALDGLLVRGEKGTAKSTAVRGLVDLLPEQRAVADCPYGCPPSGPGRCADCRGRANPPVEERPVPLVTLPLGATRDRVVGSLSVADALDGDPQFEPGLLARANRGVLYVDEVNLLDDHLVDVLLDAAAAGVNRVERDGVSVEHPARFTLVGTMNPEEGDLRPQLRDRFALQATVTACEDVEDRVAVIDRALGDEPTADGGGATDRDAEHRDRLRRARRTLPDVTLDRDGRRRVAVLCRDAGVEGHRGDIAVARAARALAALDGRRSVVASDVRRAAELALPHRLRSRPFEDAPDPDEVIDDQFDDHFDDADSAASNGGADDADGAEDAPPDGEGKEGGNEDGRDERGATGDADPAGDRSADEGADDAEGDLDRTDDGSTPPPDAANGDGQPDDSGKDDSDAEADPADGDEHAPAATDASDGAEGDDPAADGAPADEAAPLVPGQARQAVGDAAAPAVEPPEVDGDGGAGRVGGTGGDGRRVRTEQAGSGAGAVDAAASLRAAASRGGDRVAESDLRRSVREARGEALVVFAVDASASMRPAMRAAKGVVFELLRDAYEHRDAVSFVAFAGEGAEVLLPPTDSVSLAARHLKDLPTGDRTPLPAGVRTAAEVVERADPGAAVVVLVTDGRANTGDPTAETRDAGRTLAATGARTVVVDAGADGRPSLVDELCDVADAECVPLDALTAERVEAAVARTRE